MSSPAGSVRHRGGQNAKKTHTTLPASKSNEIDAILDVPKTAAASGSEWDFKLALCVITTLAFVTRFWGINHPDQVVFDEVHFGKVRSP